MDSVTQPPDRPLKRDKKKPITAESLSPFFGNNERILCVDDDQIIIKMLSQVIERLGYHVTSHISSIEAYEDFKANPENFDMVITDMVMPDMTGDQLVQKIKAIRPSIPTLIITGYSDILNDEMLNALDIHGVLKKPVSTPKLAATIKKVLDNAKASALL